MGYFPVRYDSRVVIYEHKMFIRLATGLPQTCSRERDGNNNDDTKEHLWQFKSFITRSHLVGRTRRAVKAKQKSSINSPLWHWQSFQVQDKPLISASHSPAEKSSATTFNRAIAARVTRRHLSVVHFVLFTMKWQINDKSLEGVPGDLNPGRQNGIRWAIEIPPSTVMLIGVYYN